VSDQLRQTSAASTEQSLRDLHLVSRPLDLQRKVWLTSVEAAAYVPCKSIKGWYEWRRRHGIVCRANGTVARADLDKALAMKQRRVWRMHPRSLANLRKRKAS